MKIILLSFWVGDFVFSYSWFLSKKLRVTDNTIFSIFHSIYSYLRTVQFAILLSYNSARFKSFKEDRGKKVLVYIFVRENSDIYRQKAGLNFWSYGTKHKKNWCKYWKYSHPWGILNAHAWCKIGNCLSEQIVQANSVFCFCEGRRLVMYLVVRSNDG